MKLRTQPEIMERTVQEYVQDHGTLAVLRALISATEVQAGVLGAKGDVVGANDILRRLEGVKRAYKEWHR